MTEIGLSWHVLGQHISTVIRPSVNGTGWRRIKRCNGTLRSMQGDTS
jgi:hypothetical protein